MKAGNVTQTGHTYPTTFESMKNKIAAVGDWIEAQGVKLTLDATEVLHRQNVAAVGYEYDDLDDLLGQLKDADIALLQTRRDELQKALNGEYGPIDKERGCAIVDELLDIEKALAQISGPEFGSAEWFKNIPEIEM